MTYSRKPVIVICCLLLTAGLSACTSQTSKPVGAQTTTQWPAKPERAKIQFLYEIKTPVDVNINPSFFQRITEAVKGGTAKQVSRPYGIAVSEASIIYAVDNAYQAVHVFDQERNDYYRFPKAPIPNFQNPVNIALGTNGRIYVSDSVSGLVHVFSNGGKTYVGNIGQGILERPTGLVTNNATTELLVLDTKSSTLVVFDEVSLAFKRIIGSGSAIDEPLVSFHYPTNIAVSATGNVFVADSLNFRIQVLDKELVPIAVFGAPGNSPGAFSRPKGIALDSDGHVYIIDAIFDNIQIFEPSGKLLLAFGGPGNAAGKFWLPNSIAIDKQDRIYVSDAYNNRIQVFQYVKQQ